MRMPLVIVLVALALVAGFLGGMAVPRAAVQAIGLTPYERGQLIVQCHGIQEQFADRTIGNNVSIYAVKAGTSGDLPTGAPPGSKNLCLSDVRKLP